MAATGSGDPQARGLPDERCLAYTGYKGPRRLAEARCRFTRTTLRTGGTSWLVQALVVATILLAFMLSNSTSFMCDNFHDFPIGAESTRHWHGRRRHSRSRRAGHVRSGHTNHLAEILPLEEAVLKVGEEKEMFCRFNSTLFNVNDVSFRRGKDNVTIPSTIVNASTISTVLRHHDTERYTLKCVANSTNICIKVITVAYPPRDLLNFSCISPNHNSLQCKWDEQKNRVRTYYAFSYIVPHFSDRIKIRNVSGQSFEIKIHDGSVGSRRNIEVLVTGNNSIGNANFTHWVDIYNVVVPNPALSLKVTAITVDSISLAYSVDHRMESFAGKLRHEVSWRAAGQNWTSVIKTKFIVDELSGSLTYEMTLPDLYANTQYDVRLRLHTAVGEVRENMWSKPIYTSATTKAKLPELAPEMDVMTFETSNALLSRDVLVYWRQLPQHQHNGANLHYRVEVFNALTDEPVDMMPVLSRLTYARIPSLSNLLSYRFKVTAVNDIGPSNSSSQIVIPKKAAMPDTPEMFTVIKYMNPEDQQSPIYRLMWKAPLNKGEDNQPIVGYTLFWCPHALYDSRCEENLRWVSTAASLDELALRVSSSAASLSNNELSQQGLFEKNLTGLPLNQQFGIAAVTADNKSSGIKWATCFVPFDDSPPAPKKPTVTALSSRTVELSWRLDCPDKSAMPLWVNISYCEEDPNQYNQNQDFENCRTPVVSQEHPLKSPATISGLRPSSSNMFSISIVSVVGASRNSLPARLTMAEDVPSGPPQSLSQSSPGNTSVLLSWQPPPQELWNGVLTSYEVSTRPLSSTLNVSLEQAAGKVALSKLRPYTRYSVYVAACTQKGCAVNHPATAAFTTTPGYPGPVNMFSLNSANGKLSWEFDEESCHGPSCSYDVKILLNGTTYRADNLVETTISLEDLNITCLGREDMLTVSLRVVGHDLSGAPLHGPWSQEEYACTLSGRVEVAWVIMGALLAAFFVVALVIAIAAKCGYNVITELWKPINVPKLTVGDLKSNDKKQQQKQQQQALAAPSDQVLRAPSYSPLHLGGGGGCDVTVIPCDENKKVPLLSQTSQNSEMDLIDAEAERHGRNLSGDSTHSSGGCSGLSSEADSALASTADAHDTSSAGSGDSSESDSRFLRQGRDNWPGSNLRQRSPGPYVLQGERPPQNISEGYVAVRSDPSLVGDLNAPNRGRLNQAMPIHTNSSNSLQRSTPNLPSITGSGSQPSLAFMKTPATSAGYFSTTESEPAGDELSVLPGLPRSRSGFGHSPSSGINATAPPYSSTGSPLPVYSRHSFTPPGSQKPPTNDNNSKNAGSELGDLRYVAVGFNNDNNEDSRLSSPESFTGLFDSKRRAPSIPSSLSVGECDRKNSMSDELLDSNSAYSLVGSRKLNIQPVPSSQGYVTHSNQPRAPVNNGINSNHNPIGSPPALLSNTSTPNKSISEQFNPYHTVGESNEIMNNMNPRNPVIPNNINPSSATGYVTVGDRGFPSGNPSLRSGNNDPGVGSNNSSARSHYVTAAPNKWAFHSSRPEQLDTADEVRYVASAPSENLRGRFHPQKDGHDTNLSPHLNERPNTSDCVMNRPKRLSQSPSTGWPTGGPSLSKQSSGYVSQEALGTEPLVMSPKRLFAQNIGTKPIKNDPHEVSFV